jgi:uncharacterized membrane protein YdbT with pleckstrin-like domain
MSDEVQQYTKLGGKTLFVLIFKRCAILILPLAILSAIIVALPFVPYYYAGYGNLAIVCAVVFLLIVLILVLLVGWLEYSRYQIFIDGESIKINRGIIREEQVGIPFRRIKEAAIERSMTDQMIGLSNLVITILGEDEGKNFSQESKIMLPALDKKIAANIQDLILKRAQVEEMNIQQK